MSGQTLKSRIEFAIAALDTVGSALPRITSLEERVAALEKEQVHQMLSADPLDLPAPKPAQEAPVNPRVRFQTMNAILNEILEAMKVDCVEEIDLGRLAAWAAVDDGLRLPGEYRLRDVARVVTRLLLRIPVDASESEVPLAMARLGALGDALKWASDNRATIVFSSDRDGSVLAEVRGEAFSFRDSSLVGAVRRARHHVGGPGAASAPAQPVVPLPLGATVRDLGLSKDVLLKLGAGGIRSVNALLTYSAADLIATKRLWKPHVREIEAVLARYGLVLRKPVYERS